VKAGGTEGSMSDDIVLRIRNVDVFHGTFQALWNVSSR